MANQNKPSDIINILVANRSKLLRFFGGFKIDRGSKLLVLTLRTIGNRLLDYGLMLHLIRLQRMKPSRRTKLKL